MPANPASQLWSKCLQHGCDIVRRHVEHPTYRRPGFPQMTLFHIPSFVDAAGWTVTKLPRGQGYELQKIVWHQQADSERMENLMSGRSVIESPEPTISAALYRLDAQEWEKRFSALATMHIPLLPEHPMGLDGESFGLRLHPQLELEWWCEGPAAWASVSEWTMSAIAYFLSQTERIG